MTIATPIGMISNMNLIVSKVSIVIVNWNAGIQLYELLRSISSTHIAVIESVIIVDNASIDESIAKIEDIKCLPFPCIIIRNDRNRGFAAACNQGACLSSSEYLLFLNPDTVLEADSISKSILFMQRKENLNIGICGIRLVKEDGIPTTAAARFPTLRVLFGGSFGLSKVFPKTFPAHFINSSELMDNCIVDQVIGAFFLIRKSVFDLCEGFDERFFVYFEEVDLSIRAKRFGYSSYYLADASAFHKGGGCSDRVKSVRLFYSMRSRLLYAKKHYSELAVASVIVLTIIEFPLRIIRSVLVGSFDDFKNTCSAYLRLVSNFRGSSF